MDWSKTWAATRRGIGYVLVLVPLATLIQRWEGNAPWTDPLASVGSIGFGIAASALLLLGASLFFMLWTRIAGEENRLFDEVTREPVMYFGFCVIAAMSTAILIVTGR